MYVRYLYNNLTLHVSIAVQTKQPPLTPPTPILNKPLPPPSPPPSAADPSGSTPTQSFNNKQTRPPPPSVFKNQPLNGQLVDSRSTSFSSVQTSNSSPTASRRPQDTSNNSLTSPQKRNPSTTLSSNNVLPPHQNQTLPPIANKKTMMTQQNPLPPPPQPTFGRQNNNLLLPSTNTSAAQTQLTASSLANHQDLHPANAAAAAVNMSMTKIGGAASSQMDINAQGTQVSDRNLDVDLPPEFAAMFHVSLLFYILFTLFSMRRGCLFESHSPLESARLILLQDSMHAMQNSVIKSLFTPPCSLCPRFLPVWFLVSYSGTDPHFLFLSK